ncbi:hypothetical protein ACIBF6_33840 [Streptosporangium amethystogenes]|uniref:hypothetical protein n=1 Tax=Streptosporangium amethystogenes TaxID=2002 RepID=UPI0037AB84A9
MISVWRTIFLIGCILTAFATGMGWTALPQRAPGAFPIFVIGLVLTIVGALRQLIATKGGKDDHGRGVD